MLHKQYKPLAITFKEILKLPGLVLKVEVLKFPPRRQITMAGVAKFDPIPNLRGVIAQICSQLAWFPALEGQSTDCTYIKAKPFLR